MTVTRVKEWKAEQRKRGNRLVVLLRDTGLTQYEVGDALGLSQSSISNYLGGRTRWPENFEQRFRQAVETLTRGSEVSA